MPEGQANQEIERHHQLQQQRMQQPNQAPALTRASQTNRVPMQNAPHAGQQMQQNAAAAELEANRWKTARNMRKKKGMDLSSPEGMAQTAAAASTAFTEISPFKDWYHWLVIMLSMLGDLATVIPLAGISIGFAIYITIITLYLISGHFKKRKEVKAFTFGLSWFIETIPILGVVPAMTGSAVLNYWYTLTERKMEKAS